MFKRIFLIVLDSLGVGEAEDASKYGDVGANTLGHIVEGRNYNLNIMEKLGFLNLVGKSDDTKYSLYCKMKPNNAGKDTLNGHYEMMGIKREEPFATYPKGFPLELISKIKELSGRDVIGNVVASGTNIIDELGEMQIKTGALIVYTSADSVLQIAAHEKVIPLEELYDICHKIREITSGSPYNIGRIISRPYIGTPNNFTRTPNRKDFAIDPPLNALDLLYKNNLQTISIGKISDIFNNKSITTKLKTKNNLDGLMKLIDFSKANFDGLCFANLNDFDSLYGHRRDKDNYLKALEEFNYYLPIFLKNLKKTDLVIFTADHGNDPTYRGTDHTRENTPLILFSSIIKNSHRIGDRSSFADISATILDNFNIENTLPIGQSIMDEIKKEDI